MSLESSLSMLKSLRCSNLMNLSPENPNGNIEYKRQLHNLSTLRIQQLITQLKWRLEEGQGEAIYLIGVEDDGTVSGLEKYELCKSMKNLCFMANSLHATVKLLGEFLIGTKKALEVLIKKIPIYYSANAHETKVALLGSSEAGKSTLVGVLTHGHLDDGFGKARLWTFKHIHEVRSGRTSCINCQLLGFDNDDVVTNHLWQNQQLHERSHEDVALSSARLVSLMDLPGCWKYQRTTLLALTSRRPRIVLLVISSSQVFSGSTVYHLRVATALRLPVAIVITKIDRCAAEHAVQALCTWLSLRFEVTVVTSTQQAFSVARDMHTRSLIPIISTSCVSGDGIDLLTAFLAAVPSCEDRIVCAESSSEVWIDGIHCAVPQVEGCVMMGVVQRGSVTENDSMFLGPFKDGNFLPITVQSIHRNRVRHHQAHGNQTVSLAISVKDNGDVTTDNGEYRPTFKWCPRGINDSADDGYIGVQRGMVLLSTAPIASEDDLIANCTGNGGRCGGHVAWGVVLTDIAMVHNEDQLTADISGLWTVNCGNVTAKCRMVTNGPWMDRAIILNMPSPKIIFVFAYCAQFVHCDAGLLFYKSPRHLTYHGHVRWLLAIRGHVTEPPL